jgi:hypothetical protein
MGLLVGIQSKNGRASRILLVLLRATICQYLFCLGVLFSANWIELQSESDQGEMEYAISDIDDLEDSLLDLEIEVGQDCDALEWWCTIMSPGQGWRSTHSQWHRVPITMVDWYVASHRSRLEGLVNP